MRSKAIWNVVQKINLVIIMEKSMASCLKQAYYQDNAVREAEG